MALQIGQVNADGTSRAGETFEHTVTDFDTGDPLEGVALTCRVITKAEGRAFYAKHTTRKADPRTRTMVETVDNAAVSDALFEHVVLSWTGVVAGDGQ